MASTAIPPNLNETSHLSAVTEVTEPPTTPPSVVASVAKQASAISNDHATLVSPSSNSLATASDGTATPTKKKKSNRLSLKSFKRLSASSAASSKKASGDANDRKEGEDATDSEKGSSASDPSPAKAKGKKRLSFSKSKAVTSAPESVIPPLPETVEPTVSRIIAEAPTAVEESPIPSNTEDTEADNAISEVADPAQALSHDTSAAPSTSVDGQTESSQPSQEAAAHYHVGAKSGDQVESAADKAEDMSFVGRLKRSLSFSKDKTASSEGPASSATAPADDLAPVGEKGESKFIAPKDVEYPSLAGESKVSEDKPEVSASSQEAESQGPAHASPPKKTVFTRLRKMSLSSKKAKKKAASPPSVPAGKASQEGSTSTASKPVEDVDVGDVAEEEDGKGEDEAGEGKKENDAPDTTDAVPTSSSTAGNDNLPPSGSGTDDEPAAPTQPDPSSERPALPPPFPASDIANAPPAEEIAKRIREAIDRVPWLPGAGESGSTDDEGKEDGVEVKAIQRDPDTGRPIPPPSSVPKEVHDQELLSWLQCVPLMNGVVQQGGKKPSKTPRKPRHAVFKDLQSLDQLQWGELKSDEPEEDEGDDEDGDDEEGEDDDQDLYSNVLGGGIMLYAPLVPQEGDAVELAKVEVISGDKDEGVEEPAKGKMVTSKWSMWPWMGKKKPDNKKEKEETATPVPAPSTPSPKQGKLRKKKATVLETKWIPSTEKLSFEAMWWGFKLYIPPPIMDILNDDQLEAAKMIAMITTALTWFFNNIPIEIFPIAVQPAILILKKLAPYVGYLGTAITWGWSQIKSYDQGHGVIMSATWILPVVMIPSTWKDADWPGNAPATPAPADPDPSIPAPTTPSPTTPAPVDPVPPTPTPTPDTPTPAPPAPSTPPAADPAQPSTPPTETAPDTPSPDPAPETSAARAEGTNELVEDASNPLPDARADEQVAEPEQNSSPGVKKKGWLW